MLYPDLSLCKNISRPSQIALYISHEISLTKKQYISSNTGVRMRTVGASLLLDSPEPLKYNLAWNS